jgi:hypothetical protein
MSIKNPMSREAMEATPAGAAFWTACDEYAAVKDDPNVSAQVKATKKAACSTTLAAYAKA